MTRFQRCAAAGILMSVGALLVIYVVGPSRINPWNTHWMADDTFDYFFGWEVYRRDPTSAFALASQRVMAPLSVNVALFDLVPVAALVLKVLFRTASEFQYIGLWYLLCGVLQGLFASLIAIEILRDTRDRSWAFIVAVLSGAFFVISPIWILRIPLHIALSSHWLMVFAIWLCFRSRHQRLELTFLQFTILGVVSGGISPYITMFCCLIYSGVLLALLFSRPGWTMRQAAWAMCPYPAAFVSLLYFGFAAVGSGGFLPGYGYGFFSANALAMFNPGFVPSGLLPKLPKAFAGQGDGYGYLGAGVILLIVLATWIFLRDRNISKGVLFAFSVVILVSFSIALSNVITVGPTVVATIPLPSSVHAILEGFRASGRFIWVVDYLLIAGSARILVKAFSGRALVVILGILVGVQILDVWPLAQFARQLVRAEKERVFSDPQISAAAAGYKRLLVVPPWQCGVRESAPAPNYMKTGRLALDLNVPTNSAYTARTPVDQWDLCGRFLEEMNTRTPAVDAFYVFSLGGFKTWGKQFGERYCELADDPDGIVFCGKSESGGGMGPKLKAALGPKAM